MIYAIVFYWVVCGFAVMGLDTKTNPGALDLILAFLFGGFIVPSLLVQRALR